MGIFRTTRHYIICSMYIRIYIHTSAVRIYFDSLVNFIVLPLSMAGKRSSNSM